MSLTTYTLVVLVVTVKIAAHTQAWSWLLFFSYVASLGFYFLFQAMYRATQKPPAPGARTSPRDAFAAAPLSYDDVGVTISMRGTLESLNSTSTYGFTCLLASATVFNCEIVSRW
jgi:hypothetical protein